MSKIDIKDRPIRGAKSAKVVVVNFDDFECPYCSQMHKTLFPDILKEYADRVTFVYKDYPLAEIHPWAIHAAVEPKTSDKKAPRRRTGALKSQAQPN